MTDFTKLKLVPQLQLAAEKLLELCEADDVNLLIYCGLRTLDEQAIIYASGRTTEQIEAKRSYFDSILLVPFAEALGKVTAKPDGKRLTMAAPGESWHNYGLAFDAVPLTGTKALWDDKAPEWQIYGQNAQKCGLYWAGLWKGKMREYPHCQLLKASNPLKVMSPYDSLEALRKIGQI